MTIYKKGEEETDYFNLIVVAVVAIVAVFAIASSTFYIKVQSAPQQRTDVITSDKISSGTSNEPNNLVGGAISTQGISIELDIPSYLPDYLKQPRKFFSGRTIKIITPFATNLQKIDFVESKGRIRSLPTKMKKEPKSFSVDIPPDVPTGLHTISFSHQGKQYKIPIQVYGLTEAEKRKPIPSKFQDIYQKVAIKYRTKICEAANCFWEMVFTGNPSNPNELVQVNLYSLRRSTDSGRTWQTDIVDEITSYRNLNIDFVGDPKVILSSNGTLFLSGLYDWVRTGNPPEWGGILYKGNISGNLSNSIFQDTPQDQEDFPRLFVDYPKLAVSSNYSSVYISGNAVWFEDTVDYWYALYASSDSGQNFKRFRLSYPVTAITSMDIGLNNTLYGVHYYGSISRFDSPDSGEFETLEIPGFPYSVARTSNNTNRAWNIYAGPEIKIDLKSSSQYNGRLYLIWAQPEAIILDENFEYGSYGYNFDIFVSYSDDRGETWSTPIKVNDDKGKGDQVFPSARVDANGVLHVAFLDHRNNQDQAVFDVYYAKSSDGIHFSRNLKITNESVSNSIGGRSVGDYLDMVAAYPDKVYIAYPCGQSDYGPTAACMVEVNPKVVR